MAVTASASTHFDWLVERAGLVAAYTYNNEVFYDTRDTFERHNLSRDVRRNLDECHYIIEKSKYYINKEGIIMYALLTKQRHVMALIMEIINAPVSSPGGRTHFDRIMKQFGLVAAYEYNGENFYDTNSTFERLNFDRDVRRILDEADFFNISGKYCLSKQGFMVYAFVKRHQVIIDLLMDIINAKPVPPVVATPRLPSPHQFAPAPLPPPPLPMLYHPPPTVVYPQERMYYPQVPMYYPPFQWNFQNTQ